MDLLVQVLLLITIFTFRFDVAYSAAAKLMSSVLLGFCHSVAQLQQSAIYNYLLSYLTTTLPIFLDTFGFDTPPYSAILICFSITIHATHYLNNESLCSQALDVETCASAPTVIIRTLVTT